MVKTKGYLALANGRVFAGWIFGANPDEKPRVAPQGEVVFNTSITGYQEILTDPSYKGQIVVMTPSHIGNYGVNAEDEESTQIYLSGFVVQEESAVFSNYRATASLDTYLKKAGVTGLTGVDTRALTRYLRDKGATNGVISADGRDLKALVKRAKGVPSLEGQNLASLVTTDKIYKWEPLQGEIRHSRMSLSGIQKPESGSPPETRGDDEFGSSSTKNIVVMDFGVKHNILRCLAERGCEVTVVPSSTPAQQIIDMDPDGVLFSNGPGDPAEVKDGVKTIEKLIEESAKRHKSAMPSNGHTPAAEKPLALFGICLGHQMMGLALGGKTYKLKFGHHGGNHPIKDLETGQVDITTQNHGFCVAGEKTAKGEWIVKGNKDAIVTHINLNDNAIEGLRHKTLPVFSVQYHPEASCGPHDAGHLFDRFMKLME